MATKSLIAGMLLGTCLAVSLVAHQSTPELALQGGNNTTLTMGAAFSADGRLLIASSLTSVRVFEVASGRVVRSFASQGAFSRSALMFGGVPFAVHPRQNAVAILRKDGSAVAYDIESGREQWHTPPLATNRNALTDSGSIRFSSDGEILAVEYGAMSMNVSFGAAFRQGLREFVSRGRRDDSAIPIERVRWRVRDNTLLGKTQTTASLNDRRTREWLTIDGRWFAEEATRDDKTFTQMRDVATGRAVGRSLSGAFVAGHAASDRAIIEDERGVFALVAVSTGAVVREPFGGFGTFSADGTRFFEWSAPTLAWTYWLVHDVGTGAQIARSSDNSPLGVTWAISPDGALLGSVQLDTLVVAPLDRLPIQYIAVGGAEQRELLTEAHLQPSDGVIDKRVAQMWTLAENDVAAAFTQDGRWFVARAHDSEFDVWDAASGNRMPFRFPPLSEKRGPIRVVPFVTTTDDPGAWRPISVQTINVTRSLTAPTGAVDGSAVMCRSVDARFEVVEEVTPNGYTATLRDSRVGRVVADLVPLGVDLRAACSVDVDGKWLIVARVDPQKITRETKPASRMSDSLGCRMFQRCSTPLVVVDVAQGTTTALRERTTAGRLVTAEYSFLARDLVWTRRGEIVVYPGARRLTNAPAVRAWKVPSGEEIDLAALGLTGTSLGMIPGTNWMVVAKESLALLASPSPDAVHEIWDLDSLQRVTQLSGLPANGALLATNGQVLVGPDGAGALFIRRISDGELLGTLRPLPRGEWIVATPSGLFDGSPEGWRQIAWRAPSGLTVQPGELFFNEFYQPGLLADVLAGRSPRLVRPIAERDRRQPDILIEATRVDDDTARVRVRARAFSDASGHAPMRDLRLFRNGVLVHAWRGELPVDAAGEFAATTDISLVSGENHFIAYAFNRDNIKSGDAIAHVSSTAPPRPGRVFVLAVGVNRYQNPAFNLRYAVPDATAFAAAVAAGQRAMRAARVEVVTLLDAAATRANILLAFGRLAGTAQEPLPPAAPIELSRFETVRPEDTVIVYFAGHGLATEERFHLIPADMTYSGSRADVARAIPELTRAAISDQDLERAFESVDARHILLVIDACNSGQAIETADNRFGPLNSRGLAHLAYDKGMSILTASQAYEAALESAQLGHGYLTFALVEEGLTAEADRTPRDGDVTAEEWFAYAVARVPQLQSAALDRAQQTGRILTFDSDSAKSIGGRLQTPRVFTRREAPESPLIVARPQQVP